VIAIADYGMGNRRSVEKALAHVGAQSVITADHDEIRAADAVILPGVGAFPEAMRNLRRTGLGDVIAQLTQPLLGICLGMQLLFESSTELGGAAGIGVLRGEVTGLEAPGLKVPHMGWEPVRWARDSELVAGLESETPFYFVHSFAVRPADQSDVLGTAEWGERFACAVARPPLYGVQFHPEKSSTAGLRVLANFAEICASVPA
jgi:glutamine amidotransferase